MLPKCVCLERERERECVKEKRYAWSNKRSDKSCLAKQTLQGRRDERNSQVKVYMAD